MLRNCKWQCIQRRGADCTSRVSLVAGRPCSGALMSASKAAPAYVPGQNFLTGNFAPITDEHERTPVATVYGRLPADLRGPCVHASSSERLFCSFRPPTPPFLPHDAPLRLAHHTPWLQATIHRSFPCVSTPFPSSRPVRAQRPEPFLRHEGQALPLYVALPSVNPAGGTGVRIGR